MEREPVGVGGGLQAGEAMKHIHQLSLTQQQCQVLSALWIAGMEKRPLDYLEIALITDLARAVLYEQARRLVARRYARKSMLPVRGSRRRVPAFTITAAGIKAREHYAIELGLRT
jgi:hypothetical protein